MSRRTAPHSFGGENTAVKNPAFSDEEIAAMRAMIHDPAAKVDGVEMISGAIFWSDEGVLELIALSRHHGGSAKELLAYRTSLLLGEPREELRFAWEEAKARCPEWIGFRPERVAFSPTWSAYVADALDSF